MSSLMMIAIPSCAFVVKGVNSNEPTNLDPTCYSMLPVLPC